MAVAALIDRPSRAAQPGPASSRRSCMRRRTRRASSSATALMGACPRAQGIGTGFRDPRAVHCARGSHDPGRKQWARLGPHPRAPGRQHLPRPPCSTVFAR